MLQELKASEFDRVRSLFQVFGYSLSIQAAIKGNSPARIFVDHVSEPRTAIALTVEGYLLAGDDSDAATNADLRRLFKECIFTGDVFITDDDAMYLAVYPKMWESKLSTLIPMCQPIKTERYHYICRTVKLNWREHIPEGYTIQRVDRTLLDDNRVIFPDSLREWFDLKKMWGTLENFISKGVSYVVLHQDQVVSWCASDCATADQIDLGIITHPNHRRHGLAAIVTAATVEHCLSHGFDTVGWHCDADNAGAWKTAEKVGFERNQEYIYYTYIYDPIEHLAELGYDHYKRGEYTQTIACYEQVFNLRDENADYHYHLAASAWAFLGNREKALKYLRQAVIQGWRNAEWTKEQPEFRILHGMPEWDVVLEQMRSAED